MRATWRRSVWWALSALMAVIVRRAAGAVRRGSTTRRSARTAASTSSTSRREAERFEKLGRDGQRAHEPGVGPERRDRRRRQRAGAPAVLLQARHLRARAGADRAASSASSGATARRASRPTSPTWRSRTASRSRYTHELPDDSRRSCPARRPPATRKGSFRIRRAKFKLEGWFWIPPEVAPSPRHAAEAVL